MLLISLKYLFADREAASRILVLPYQRCTYFQVNYEQCNHSSQFEVEWSGKLLGERHVRHIHQTAHRAPAPYCHISPNMCQPRTRYRMAQGGGRILFWAKWVPSQTATEAICSWSRWVAVATRRRKRKFIYASTLSASRERWLSINTLWHMQPRLAGAGRAAPRPMREGSGKAHNIDN